MKTLIIAAAAVILAALAGIFLVHWVRFSAKAKQNREQMNQKLRESRLDNALSNSSHQSGSSQAQAPVTVRYASKPQTENVAMLRLTEQAENAAREYLFQRNETFFLGEEYGRAAVFREQQRNMTCCEVFSYQGNVYARQSGGGECRLLRGSKASLLTEKAFRLRSGDRLATRLGTFLVELI